MCPSHVHSELIHIPDKRGNRISPNRVETIGWFQDGAVDRH